MNFSFVHEFDTDVASYWKLFLSDPFNEDLFRELKIRERKVLKFEDNGKTLYRTQKMEPTTPLPGFLQSMIKDMGYTEIDKLDWASNIMRIIIEPASMKDRFKMEGDYVVTPLGDKRCRREFKGEVKVSMPLIGGKVEKFMMEQLRDAYDTAARVTRKWIAEGKTGA